MDFIMKLQDPQIVANFQNYFGVRVKYRKKELPGDSNMVECKTHYDQEKFEPLKHRSQESTEKNMGIWKAAFAENTGGSSDIGSDEDFGTECEDQTQEYEILNRFWYHLFFFATGLGGEYFYSVFFCFWAWNVDGAVLRRVIVIWMITMYIGQAMKDILKVPRPSAPPVLRLDTKWALEYGLPSTHAMVGVTMPFSIFAFSVTRYQLDWSWCLAFAITWCTIVCLSRLYLGMHSVMDIVCGLVLAVILMVIILPWMDILDRLALSHPASPLLCTILTVAMVVWYPTTDRWTPARGDTTVIVGVGCGTLLGSWLNYQLGIIREPTLPPPYTVIWPTINMVGLSLLRTVVGLVLIVAVRATFKSLSYATICALLQVRADDVRKKKDHISSRKRLIVELFYKFITYIAIGFTIIFTAPVAFRVMGVERPTFYTEI
ncbi:unnamed protein product [Meganyctiphanes norvegica]|uniref:Phosphatidic acid phosphatase type 2/haloperoxidase domain-containing protein n=1 Tax=Meganyctiphanes norvegica TaxID=48144 RepID=A0AAV2RQE2_MEGNR